MMSGMSPRPRSTGPSVPPPPRREGVYWTTRWRGSPRPDGGRSRYRRSWLVADVPSRQHAMAAYAQWLGLWQSDPGVSDPDAHPSQRLTVHELGERYYRHATRTFVDVDGEATKHVDRVRRAMELLANLPTGRRQYAGSLPADALTPPLLARYRDSLTARADGEPRARNSVNDNVSVVKAAYRWAAEYGLVDPSVWHALQAVTNLQRGRTQAVERRKVDSVPRSRVDAVLPLITPPAAALVEVLWHTGMRSNEACLLRADRIDMGDPRCWLYCPEKYKGQHRDDRSTRIVALTPKAQAFIEPWLTSRIDAYLFKPVGPRSRRPRYTPTSLRLNIRRACEQVWPSPADLSGSDATAWRTKHHWTTHQLRHAKATSAYLLEGHEAAAGALGHRGEAPDVTLAYIDEAVLNEERKKQAIALALRLEAS